MWFGGTSGPAEVGAGRPGSVGRPGRPQSTSLPAPPPGPLEDGKNGGSGLKVFLCREVALSGGGVEAPRRERQPRRERRIPFGVCAACDFPGPPSYLRGAHRPPPGRPFLFSTFLPSRFALPSDASVAATLEAPGRWLSGAPAVPLGEEGTSFAGSGLGPLGRVLQVVLQVKEGLS